MYEPLTRQGSRSVISRVMVDSSSSNSSLEVTKLDKGSSIARPPSAIDDDSSTPKPLEDHATAGLPKKIPAQNDEFVSIVSVVQRLEAVRPSAMGFSETNDADVLSGRGGGTNLHPGNRYFRQLIVSHCNAYDKATKSKKPLVARDVVQQIRRRGGRFLRKDSNDGLFYEIGDDLAREKASQAFRHRTFELRRQQGPHYEKEIVVPDTKQIHHVKRMRTTPTDQNASDKEGDDVTKRQKNDVIVAVAYPAHNADGDGHSIDRMNKDDIEESSSAKLSSENFILKVEGVPVGSWRIQKEMKEGLTRTTASRALESGAPEPSPPPPLPDVDTYPSFLYHSSGAGPRPHLLSGLSPGHPSFGTMLPRRVTSASGPLLGGNCSSWDPRYPAAMATRRSSTSSVSSSELSRSSRPSLVGRPEELTQQCDEMRISLDSLTTHPTIMKGGVHAISHPHPSAVDDGTGRLVQSSLRTSLVQPQASSSSGLRGFLPGSSDDTRFLPQGFQSPWSVLAPLWNRQLVLPQPSSLAATPTASLVPLSTQAAAVEEYERSLLAEYVLLRRIQEKRATLFGRLVHEQQEQQQEQHQQQEQSKESQNYTRPTGYR